MINSARKALGQKMKMMYSEDSLSALVLVTGVLLHLNCLEGLENNAEKDGTIIWTLSLRRRNGQLEKTR